MIYYFITVVYCLNCHRIWMCMQTYWMLPSSVSKGIIAEINGLPKLQTNEGLNPDSANLEFTLTVHEWGKQKINLAINLWLHWENNHTLNGTEMRKKGLWSTLYLLFCALSLPENLIVPEWTLTVTQDDTNKRNWHTQLFHGSLFSLYPVPYFWRCFLQLSMFLFTS